MLVSMQKMVAASFVIETREFISELSLIDKYIVVLSDNIQVEEFEKSKNVIQTLKHYLLLDQLRDNAIIYCGVELLDLLFFENFKFTKKFTRRLYLISTIPYMFRKICEIYQIE